MTRNVLPTFLAALALSVSPFCLTGAMAQEQILPKSQGSAGSSQEPMKPTDGGAQGNKGATGTTGSQNGAAQSGGGDTSGTSGSATKIAPDGTASGSKEAKPKAPEGTDQSTGQNVKPQDGSGSNKTDTTTGEAQKPTGSGDQSNTGKAAKQAEKPDKTTTSSTNVDINVEQQTEIRQVVKEVDVKPVEKVDFDVSVGTTIPKTVTLEPLPPRIVEIVPQYKSYRFFVLADGRIVIVDPDDFRIVYILTA
ncbi:MULTISPECIES: DUF1236 domain-containing protein [unclassified Sinorhizobium]|uniref:DUF1236 domain-containing protein n=1 Tax=unclassified Sinorhizobium TaxID=2613772 RepID=UPI003524868E